MDIATLINGINFSGDGIKFTTANTRASGGFTIAWYGIIILTGTVIILFVSDHHFYQEYHKHGLMDSMCIVAFLIGVIGARFWYCVVLEPGTNFWAFQDGGLAIMGGIIFGEYAGLIYDGAFSEHLESAEKKGLIGEEINEEQAKQIATETIGEDVSAKYDIAKDESIQDIINKLTDEMLKCASDMEFEKAAELRDKIKELEGLI